jgi:hypothetical protein
VYCGARCSTGTGCAGDMWNPCRRPVRALGMGRLERALEKPVK